MINQSEDKPYQSPIPNIQYWTPHKQEVFWLTDRILGSNVRVFDLTGHFFVPNIIRKTISGPRYFSKNPGLDPHIGDLKKKSQIPDIIFPPVKFNNSLFFADTLQSPEQTNAISHTQQQHNNMKTSLKQTLNGTTNGNVDHVVNFYQVQRSLIGLSDCVPGRNF